MIHHTMLLLLLLLTSIIHRLVSLHQVRRNLRRHTFDRKPQR